MKKIYCKKCKHVGKTTENYAETTEYHCFHDVCFKDKNKDTPFSKGIGNTGEETIRRVSDMHELNTNNECQYYEVRVNIFKRIHDCVRGYLS